jgi:short-subunit dehydrogenase
MILVTGASQGIGYACARSVLARTDSEVLITGRSTASLELARDAVPAGMRHRLSLRVCDQDRREEVEALAGWLAKEAPPLEGAILTVGANPLYTEGPRRLHALEPATIAATIHTNCTQVVQLSALLLDQMRQQRSGTLVWIGSRAARAGLPGASIYCATKSFLSGLAIAAHHEYAGRGVRVHLFHPGIVRTSRTERVADAFAARHGLPVREAREVGDEIVSLFLRRDGVPVEVDL